MMNQLILDCYSVACQSDEKENNTYNNMQCINSTTLIYANKTYVLKKFKIFFGILKISHFLISKS